MSAMYPVILLLATGFVWVLMAWQNSRLVHLFWQRLPHIAQRELPATLDRHPEKAIFFFRRRAVEVLRGDEVLWRQRQRFLFLFALSVLVPVLGFVSIGIVAYIQSHQ
jgi:hypothetical protein